jgi:hypothetical protein
VGSRPAAPRRPDRVAPRSGVLWPGSGAPWCWEVWGALWNCWTTQDWATRARGGGCSGAGAWTGCRRAAAGVSRASCGSYSSDSATVHPTSMPWYGDGRRPACAETQARDRWVVRNSPYGAAPGLMRRLAFLEGWRGGEPAARGSRQWGNGPARTLRWRGGWRTAHSAARPAERPARRRRSGARLSSFSAGQRVFD